MLMREEVELFEALEEAAGGFVVVAIENDRSGRSGQQQRATPDSDDGNDRAASWR